MNKNLFILDSPRTFSPCTLLIVARFQKVLFLLGCCLTLWIYLVHSISIVVFLNWYRKRVILHRVKVMDRLWMMMVLFLFVSWCLNYFLVVTPWVSFIFKINTELFEIVAAYFHNTGWTRSSNCEYKRLELYITIILNISFSITSPILYAVVPFNTTIGLSCGSVWSIFISFSGVILYKVSS